jgi:DNA-binding transcriptional LysR family regulator
LIQATLGGTVVPWSLSREGAAADATIVEVQGRLRTNAPSALRDLALRGAGIAYLPDWVVAADIERGALRRVLPQWSSPTITAWAMYRAELRGAPRLRAFLDALPSSASQIGRVDAD